MKLYRVTYREEIWIEAENEQEAEEKFENADLSNAEFVELCSIEEDDED